MTPETNIKEHQPPEPTPSAPKELLRFLGPVVLAVLAVSASAYVQHPLSGLADVPPPRSLESAHPSRPFCFNVLFNGDGQGPGVTTCTNEYDGLDSMMYNVCKPLGVKQHLCEPNSGVKLYTSTGKRVFSFLDIQPRSRTYLVPQGLLFVWPTLDVGTVLQPESVESPIEDKPITLKYLSQQPLVLSVENFMTTEEISSLIDNNRERVKRSEVGFSGWYDDDRTSSTSWDASSAAAKKIQRRSFDVLALDYDPDLADVTQVLRYEVGEWYKPHVDYFGKDGFENGDPTVNNGTNRFVTVFLYLSDVEKGGYTVFPHSTSHEGYNGEYLTHKGTVNTAGYIANKDAAWVCNETSTSLKSVPRAGNAVIFYGQLPNGTLDPYSLHGGCPVVEGTKWSANVWIWNRPKPSKSAAKDGGKKGSKGSNSISILFVNEFPFPVDLLWDSGTELVDQGHLEADGGTTPMTTYPGHTFKARGQDGAIVFSYTAKPKDKGETIVFSEATSASNSDDDLEDDDTDREDGDDTDREDGDGTDPDDEVEWEE